MVKVERLETVNTAGSPSAPSSAKERLAVVKALIQTSPKALHIVISGAFTMDDWHLYRSAGARGYLAKTRVVPGSIAAAIRVIQADGSCILPPEHSSSLPDFHYARLTQREQEALDWVRKKSKTTRSDALFEELAEKNGIDASSAQKFYKRARAKPDRQHPERCILASTP